MPVAPAHPRTAAQLPLCFVLCEGRASDAIGVKLLLASLQKHAPDNEVLAYISEPLLSSHRAQFETLHKRLKLIKYRGPENWSCKPSVLLDALATRPGHRVVWIDVDIIALDDLSPLATVDPSTLIVAEESNPNDNSRVERRLRRLELPPGTPKETTVSSCIVGVTENHQQLLKRWQELMQHDAFQLEQMLPTNQRKLFLGDQEVWEAALCESEQFAWPLYWLLNDAEMVQANYTTFRPTRPDKSTSPMFVHATGNLKPWRSGRERLPQEMFPYYWLAKPYLNTLTPSERAHFRQKSPFAWLWRHTGGGFKSYRGFRRMLNRMKK